MRETIHAFIDAKEDTTVGDELAEVVAVDDVLRVAVDDVLRDKLCRDEVEFGALKGCAEEKINNIEGGEACVCLEVMAIETTECKKDLTVKRSAVEALTRPG